MVADVKLIVHSVFVELAFQLGCQRCSAVLEPFFCFCKFREEYSRAHYGLLLGEADVGTLICPTVDANGFDVQVDGPENEDKLIRSQAWRLGIVGKCCHQVVHPATRLKSGPRSRIGFPRRDRKGDVVGLPSLKPGFEVFLVFGDSVCLCLREHPLEAVLLGEKFLFIFKPCGDHIPINASVFCCE